MAKYGPDPKNWPPLPERGIWMVNEKNRVAGHNAADQRTFGFPVSHRGRSDYVGDSFKETLMQDMESRLEQQSAAQQVAVERRFEKKLAKMRATSRSIT